MQEEERQCGQRALKYASVAARFDGLASGHMFDKATKRVAQWWPPASHWPDALTGVYNGRADIRAMCIKRGTHKCNISFKDFEHDTRDAGTRDNMKKREVINAGVNQSQILE